MIDCEDCTTTMVVGFRTQMAIYNEVKACIVLAMESRGFSPTDSDKCDIAEIEAEAMRIAERFIAFAVAGFDIEMDTEDGGRLVGVLANEAAETHMRQLLEDGTFDGFKARFLENDFDDLVERACKAARPQLAN